MHNISHNSQLSCTSTDILRGCSNKTSQGSEYHLLQANFEQRCNVQLTLLQTHTPNVPVNIRQQCCANTDPDQLSTRGFLSTRQILGLPSPRLCISYTPIMFMQAFATDDVAQTACRNKTRPAAAAPALPGLEAFTLNSHMVDSQPTGHDIRNTCGN